MQSSQSYLNNMQWIDRRMDGYLSIFVKPAQILASTVPNEARVGCAVVTGIMNSHDAHGPGHFLS